MNRQLNSRLLEIRGRPSKLHHNLAPLRSPAPVSQSWEVFKPPLGWNLLGERHSNWAREGCTGEGWLFTKSLSILKRGRYACQGRTADGNWFSTQSPKFLDRKQSICHGCPWMTFELLVRDGLFFVCLLSQLNMLNPFKTSGCWMFDEMLRREKMRFWFVMNIALERALQ